MSSEDNFAEERKAMMLQAEAVGDLNMWAGQRELHRLGDKERRGQEKQPKGSVSSVLHYPLVDLLMS